MKKMYLGVILASLCSMSVADVGVIAKFDYPWGYEALFYNDNPYQTAYCRATNGVEEFRFAIAPDSTYTLFVNGGAAVRWGCRYH